MDKKYKQDLGIFYTPPDVVNFIFNILKSWKDQDAKNNKKWDLKPGGKHFPSVIDPACGEGVFLKAAVTSGFTGYHPTLDIPYIFGVDLDKSVVNRWSEISIKTDLFKGKEQKMNQHFRCQNGLLPLPPEVIPYKKGGLEQNDAVVGNPPYGGLGVDLSADGGQGLLKVLKNYEIFWYRLHRNKPDSQKGTLPTMTPFMFGNMEESLPLTRTIGINEVKAMAQGTPIEILFVERFFQLAKPGAWIAMVIPDGILANSSSHYAREYISDHGKVEIIISLPRNTFKGVGTNAKTSILMIRKWGEGEKTILNYPVFLSSIEDISLLLQVFTHYQGYNPDGGIMTNNAKQYVSDDGSLMIRVDKTMTDLMTEKPASRWDVKYWDQKYDYLGNSSFKTQLLSTLLVENKVISADTVRESRGEKYGPSLNEITSIKYYTVRGILNTGYDLEKLRYGSENAYKRLKRSALTNGDIAVSRSGTGSLGKCFYYEGLNEPNIVSDLYILRCDKAKINPIYLLILLKSKYGKDQIERNEKGVSGQTKITNEMIENFLVPKIKNSIQINIESEYRKISTDHDLAMKARVKGDTLAYENNIKKAEEKLKDLIAKTEAVIRGEQEDVV